MDRLSPITVLVGRNNTGKSALLESFALASTAESSWYDIRGTDIIETIVLRRGGWAHAGMMVKIGEQVATIQTAGDNNTGRIQMTSNIENLSEKLRANFVSLISDYVDLMIRRYIEITARRSAKSPIAQRQFERRIESAMGRLKNNMLQQVKAYISCSDKMDKKSQYAAVVGEQIEYITESIAAELGEHLERYVPLTEIIRSPRRAENRALFMLTPSRQYLADLQRSLTKSGDLINLIDIMKERVEYFNDIREVDEGFFVFLKGLKRPVPLESMGDGFRAKLALIAATLIVKGGIILMEEPEMRLHPGFMSSIADQIVATASRKEAQYVISTHSLDFLRFLLEENTELINVIRMYRIAKTAEIDYEIMKGSEAYERIKDLEEDLRGA